MNINDLPNRNLLVQSQQWKHQNDMWNLWKVNKKTAEQRHWRRSDVFIVNFEQISHILQVFLLLTLNK